MGDNCISLHDIDEDTECRTCQGMSVAGVRGAGRANIDQHDIRTGLFNCRQYTGI